MVVAEISESYCFSSYPISCQSGDWTTPLPVIFSVSGLMDNADSKEFSSSAVKIIVYSCTSVKSGDASMAVATLAVAGSQIVQLIEARVAGLWRPLRQGMWYFSDPMGSYRYDCDTVMLVIPLSIAGGCYSRVFQWRPAPAGQGCLILVIYHIRI